MERFFNSAIATSSIHQVSIRDLVIRHPDQEGMMLMVVKAYFDGSGKSHDPNIECVSFAGYVGTEEVWNEFEEAWQGFKENHQIDFFHTSANYGGQFPYENSGGGQRVLMRVGLIELLRSFNRKASARSRALFQ
jgi:hypothetical protein